MPRLALILLLALAPAGQGLRAGEVGSTLGKYSVAGAGVGALLGAVAATLPYLQSQEPYDFLTGAGVGLLAGSGVGFVLGIVDLANPPESALTAPPPEGWALALGPGTLAASYRLRF